jgi:hypothetical protein
VIAHLLRIDWRLVLVALLGSLLISLWANIVDDVVNNDGIEYLKSAQNMLDGQWREAVETYKWPLYSALMALISKLTHLSLEVSAYVIDGFAFAWIVISFVALVRLLGGSKTELWLALLLVLCFPTLNKIRPYLIRDPAFLALFLTAIYYYFCYFLEHKKRLNLLAIGFFGLSALFRIEGLVFLIMSQVYLMAISTSRKGARWIATGLTLVLVMVMLVVLSWWNFTPDGNLTYLSIFSEPINFLETVWAQLLDQVVARLHAIRSRVLVGYSHSYAYVVLLWSALTIVFFELLDALYFSYAILFGIAVSRKEIFPQRQLLKPWRFLLMVALGILIAFVLLQWFLTDRYPLSAALLILLPIPFLLAKWLRAARGGATNKKSKIVFTVVMSLIILAGLKSFDLATKKTYLKESGIWLKHNIQPEASIYTNNKIIAHYIGRNVHDGRYRSSWKGNRKLALIASRKYDYLALNVEPKDAQYALDIPLVVRREPLIIFENEKGAKVLIIEMNNKRADHSQ